MSGERTQAPSRLRRQRAREQGHAPHSPDLTSAVGLLAGLVLLGAWGPELGMALGRLITVSIDQAGAVDADGAATIESIVGLVRHSVGFVFVPVGSIILGTWLAVVVTHQVQTGGLWAPARLVPDVGRIWRLGGGSDDELDLAAPLLQSFGRLARLMIFVAVVAGLLITRAPLFARLGRLEPTALALAGFELFRTIALPVAVVGVVLGLAEFALRFRAFEDRLRLTADEQRAEQKAIDGDPAVRSRRVRQAREWLRDPGELLAGASLVISGRAGMSILLAGSPPPGRVTVRMVTVGVAASQLRNAAERAGLPVVSAPALVRWFASQRSHPSAMPPNLASELAAHWPGSARRASR